METFCPPGDKAEPQPLSVWCVQWLPSKEEDVCVCVCVRVRVCVCGGPRGLEQLCSGEASQKRPQPGLKVRTDSDKSS